MIIFIYNVPFLGLWKLALEADFSDDELDSIKVELKHYEHRIKKLRHLVSSVSFLLIVNTFFKIYAFVYFRKLSWTWWTHVTKRNMKSPTDVKGSIQNLSNVPRKLKKFTQTWLGKYLQGTQNCNCSSIYFFCGYMIMTNETTITSSLLWYALQLLNQQNKVVSNSTPLKSSSFPSRPQEIITIVEHTRLYILMFFLRRNKADLCIDR